MPLFAFAAALWMREAADWVMGFEGDFLPLEDDLAMVRYLLVGAGLARGKRVRRGVERSRRATERKSDFLGPSWAPDLCRRREPWAEPFLAGPYGQGPGPADALRQHLSP